MSTLFWGYTKGGRWELGTWFNSGGWKGLKDKSKEEQRSVGTYPNDEGWSKRLGTTSEKRGGKNKKGKEGVVQSTVGGNDPRSFNVPGSQRTSTNPAVKRDTKKSDKNKHPNKVEFTDPPPWRCTKTPKPNTKKKGSPGKPPRRGWEKRHFTEKNSGSG